jgi:glycosyltransferase involved in cell wall biosynthesis
VRRLLGDGEFDVVHSHAPVPAAVARLAGRSLGAARRPVLVSTQHSLWAGHRLATRLANAVTFPADDHHLAVSEAVRSSIPPPLRKDVEVVVHGVDRAGTRAHLAARDETRASLGIGPDEIVVGMVANYRALKAWPDYLVAARRTLDAGTPVRFIGIGQGPQAEEIEALHASMAFGDRFQLLGYKPDAARFMAAMDVFCLCSLHEGLPVALMEALVLGRPVVATDVGGVAEMVDDGREGLLVPPSDPAALSDAITKVVTDPTLRASLAQRAEAKGEQFGIDPAVQTIEARYDELLTARARRA